MDITAFIEIDSFPKNEGGLFMLTARSAYLRQLTDRGLLATSLVATTPFRTQIRR